MIVEKRTHGTGVDTWQTWRTGPDSQQLEGTIEYRWTSDQPEPEQVTRARAAALADGQIEVTNPRLGVLRAYPRDVTVRYDANVRQFEATVRLLVAQNPAPDLLHEDAVSEILDWVPIAAGSPNITVEEIVDALEWLTGQQTSEIEHNTYETPAQYEIVGSKINMKAPTMRALLVRLVEFRKTGSTALLELD